MVLGVPVLEQNNGFVPVFNTLGYLGKCVFMLIHLVFSLPEIVSAPLSTYLPVRLVLGLLNICQEMIYNLWRAANRTDSHYRPSI